MKFLNLLIQLLWVVVALFLGYYIASSVFESLLWQCIFSGIFSLLTYFFLYFVYSYIKAFNDPDVRAASALGMSVIRYRKLKQYGLASTKEPWRSKFTTGSRLLVMMEDDSFVNGIITDIDTRRHLYIVTFEEPVSLMPAEEPNGGWSDNAYPSTVLELTDEDLDLILGRKLIGTNVHYHF
jgi:hypothetical protein